MTCLAFSVETRSEVKPTAILCRETVGLISFLVILGKNLCVFQRFGWWINYTAREKEEGNEQLAEFINFILKWVYFFDNHCYNIIMGSKTKCLESVPCQRSWRNQFCQTSHEWIHSYLNLKSILFNLRTYLCLNLSEYMYIRCVCWDFKR